MKIEKTAMEYSARHEALGRSQMKAGGGRISVFSSIFSIKGNYVLSND